MTDIVAINRQKLLALTSDNRVGKITQMFDRDGDETSVTADAIAAVICLSPLEWYTIVMVDFPEVPLH
jgi:hypothetical protein